MLRPLIEQADRLIECGVVDLCTDLGPDELREAAEQLRRKAPDGSLLVLAETTVPASALVPFMSRRQKDGSQKPGFVVEDMTDIDLFLPTIALPDFPVYALAAPDRGDQMRNWSPAEALVGITEDNRSPMTLVEGIQWVIQDQAVLEPGACFMTIASRLRKGNGAFDARTPALWISGGTGRDGKERRGAPKAGWCWWNNRHTWLGFGSGSVRITA